MGIWSGLLRRVGWVPEADLPSFAPEAIICPSYGLKDFESVTPLTESITRQAAVLYKKHDNYPAVIFTTSDFVSFDGVKDFEIEAKIRTDLLTKGGVDPGKIFFTTNTHNTESETEEIKKILDRIPNVTAVIICANELHLRRAESALQTTIGRKTKVYSCPVPCESYTTCISPPGWRAISIRNEFIWASYMLLTWMAWKLKVI